MKKKSKLKLALIPDMTVRKQTFKKRKRGFVKKLNELVTLCDVKVCAVIYSPYQSNPEAWPSREGVEEVVSGFLALPETEQTKKMLNQEAYLLERIKKEEEKLNKLRDENRESQLRESMFDCLKGKMVGYNYDATNIQDLVNFVDHYISKLTHRVKRLSENGESSYFPPPLSPSALALVADPTLRTVVDQIQYHNMNMQQEDPVQQQDMGVNANLNKDMNSNQILEVSLNSNQYPSHEISFTELLGIHEQMGYVGERGNIPLTFGSNQHDHQFSAANIDPFAPYVTTAAANDSVSCIPNGLSTAPHMPFTNTENANGFAPYISNNVSTMVNHFPSLATTNVNGSPFYFTNDLSPTNNMPSISTANANVFSRGCSFE